LLRQIYDETKHVLVDSHTPIILQIDKNEKMRSKESQISLMQAICVERHDPLTEHSNGSVSLARINRRQGTHEKMHVIAVIHFSLMLFMLLGDEGGACARVRVTTVALQY